MAGMICKGLCVGTEMGCCPGVSLIVQGVAMRGRSFKMFFVLLGTGGLILLCRGRAGWRQDSWHPAVSGKEDMAAYLPCVNTCLPETCCCGIVSLQ